MPGKGWRQAPDGTWTPPNQMRHTLEIEEDTQEWLEEMMNKYLAGKGIEAVGEAAEGFLSNPASALWIGGGILATIAALVGADLVNDLTEYFGDLETLISPDAPREDKVKAANNAANLLKNILRLSPLGSGLIPP